MMSRETMKLALEALIAAYQGKDKTGQVTEAITALREALAEQPAQQEPAFYRHKDGHLMTPDRAKFLSFELNELQPLYTSPPAQQGRVAWTLLLTGENQGLVGKSGEKFVGAPDYYKRVDVYTSSQRTWVGLTDEDKHYLNDVLNLQERFPVIDAIEAKLRSKNEDRN